MLDKTIITQPNGNGKQAQFEQAFIPSVQPNKQFTPEQILSFLDDKITEYTGIVERQRNELKHSEILLKGFYTWKAEIERKNGGKP